MHARTYNCPYVFVNARTPSYMHICIARFCTCIRMNTKYTPAPAYICICKHIYTSLTPPPTLYRAALYGAHMHWLWKIRNSKSLCASVFVRVCVRVCARVCVCVCVGGCVLAHEVRVRVRVSTSCNSGFPSPLPLPTTSPAPPPFFHALTPHLLHSLYI